MLVKGGTMKHAGLYECWTCERLKRGECKNPVSTDKKSHGGCSQWENKALYDAWYAEHGKGYEEIMEAVKVYEKEREND